MMCSIQILDNYADPKKSVILHLYPVTKAT